MQSGLFYGALGQVDGILSRLIEVLGPETMRRDRRQASLIARFALSEVRGREPHLDGLRLIWEKNR
jgi:hypothetical protein